MEAQLEGQADGLSGDLHGDGPLASRKGSLLEAAQATRSSGLAASLLGRLGLALAAAFICALLYVALSRIAYPFELEWAEGGLLQEMNRVLAGQGLYVEPTLEYVPFIYNPLYLWVCAALAPLFGPDFFTMRLVSLSATVGSLFLIASLIRKETDNLWLGLLGAGFYAATFKLCSWFMDLARVDSLFVFLFLAAVWFASTRATQAGRWFSACLLVASFLVKQSGMLAIAPLVLFLVWEAWQSSARLAERLTAMLPALAVPVGIGACVAVLDGLSDGWYTFYAFELPSQHRLVPYLWVEFWTVDLMASVPCLCLFALFALLGPGGLERRSRLLWGAALLGVLLTSYSSRLHDGGWPNVLMPAFAVLAALSAIAIHGGYQLSQRLSPPEAARSSQFLALLVVVQLAMLIYDPRQGVPQARDERAGAELVATLRSAPGDVLVLSHGYLATMAGKRPHLHELAVRDVMRAKDGTVRDRLVRDIVQSMQQRRWSLLITSSDMFAREVLANYRRVRQSVADPEAFFPVAGAKFRPGWLFLPK